jgi:hypothetical protein
MAEGRKGPRFGMKRRSRRSRCRICGKLYWPDRRLRGRQQVCERSECLGRRHRLADREWHARHPDYDVGRRLRVLRERLEGSGDIGDVVRDESPPVCALPADEVQEEFGNNGLAILVVMARLLSRHSQDAKSGQVTEITPRFAN